MAAKKKSDPKKDVQIDNTSAEAEPATKVAVSSPKEVSKEVATTPTKEKSEGNSMMGVYAFIIIGLIIVIGAVAFVMTDTSKTIASETNDAELIGAALAQTKSVMDSIESNLNITIDQLTGSVTENGDNYLVTFATDTGSNKFMVLMSPESKALKVGLNGNLQWSPSEFLMQIAPNDYQKCAKLFNDNYVGFYLVDKLLNGTKRARYMVDMPDVLNCSGSLLPYSIEIAQGYIKTTVTAPDGKNYYHRLPLPSEVIVQKAVTIPKEDTAKGIIVYVDRVEFDEFRYSYELAEESQMKFDAYDTELALSYNVTTVPRLIWNCQAGIRKTLALAELRGEVPSGTEFQVLVTLTCLYNNAEPKEICQSLGITRAEDGTVVGAQIPNEYIISNLYKTGEMSCVPSDNTSVLQAFYSPDSEASLAQRALVEELDKLFGDSLSVEYYCVGDDETCKKLVEITSGE